MSQLTRKRIIQIAVESVKGTKVAGTLLLQVEDLLIDPTMEYSQRPGSGASLGNDLPGTLGERSGDVSFTTELMSDGSAGLNTGLVALFQASGFKQTVEVYEPTSNVAVMKTISIDVFEDGNKKSLAGAAGTWTIESDVGMPAKLKWEFKGVWQPKVAAALPSVTLIEQLPMKMTAFTLGAAAVNISKYSLALNAKVEYVRDGIEAGVINGLVVQTDPELSIDPEDQLVGDYDWNGLWLAGTVAAVVMTFSDGTDTATLTMAKVVAKELKGGDREDIKTYDYLGQANNSASGADDAISIAIT